MAPQAPLRDHVAYWVRRTRPGHSFELAGRRYRYYVAAYNTTWANERAVELPVCLDALERHRGQRVLEIGNVLKHYVTSAHDVVDKYEAGGQSFPIDILDFAPAEPYDLIVSISTFEHIGFDEDVRDPGKPVRALEHARTLLAPGGELLVTVPLGYNATLDRQIHTGAVGFDDMRFLKRVSADNRWAEVAAAEVAGARYDAPFPKANALLLGRTAA